MYIPYDASNNLIKANAAPFDMFQMICGFPSKALLSKSFFKKSMN